MPREVGPNRAARACSRRSHGSKLIHHRTTGLTVSGATPEQAASGLMTECVVKEFLGIWVSAGRMPISIERSTLAQLC
jgi:predicted benzoate:H+ symporter BenE